MAESPKKAREKVALATTEFADPVGPNGSALHSPWYDPALAECVPDTSRTDIPVDAVITVDGRRIEAHTG